MNGLVGHSSETAALAWQEDAEICFGLVVLRVQRSEQVGKRFKRQN